MRGMELGRFCRGYAVYWGCFIARGGCIRGVQDTMCAAFSAGGKYAESFEVFLKFYRENESVDLEKLRDDSHGKLDSFLCKARL